MAPDLAFEERELEDFHERTLVSLPDTCRRAFSMVRDADAPYDVVAEALGVSRSAVHAHVVTAQRRFRRKLAQIGIAAPVSQRGAA
jgi:DNA-directed RNA polymerase specialized sigma24 family protein